MAAVLLLGHSGSGTAVTRPRSGFLDRRRPTLGNVADHAAEIARTLSQGIRRRSAD